MFFVCIVEFSVYLKKRKKGLKYEGVLQPSV